MSYKISDEAKLRYLERRKADINTCQNALAEKNFEFLKNVGHQYKGSASTFGHTTLAQLGESLESKAEAREAEAVRKILKLIEDYLKGCA